MSDRRLLSSAFITVLLSLAATRPVLAARPTVRSSAVATRPLRVYWRVAVTGPAPLTGPVVLGADLLVADAAGGLHRLDAASGVAVARQDLQARARLLVSNGSTAVATLDGDEVAILGHRDAEPRTVCLAMPVVTPPALGDGLVLVAQESSLVAYDVGSLGVAWTAALGAKATATPGYDPSGVIAVATSGGNLVTLRASDGTRIEVAEGLGPLEVAPVRLANLWLAGAAGHKLVAVAERGGGARFRAEIGRGPAAPLAAAFDLVYAATHAGQLLAIPASGSPRWRRSLAGRVLLAPTLWHNSVLVVPHRLGRVDGFDAATGTPTFSFTLGKPFDWFTSAAIAAADSILLTTRGGDVVALVEPSQVAAAPGAPPGATAGR